MLKADSQAAYSCTDISLKTLRNNGSVLKSAAQILLSLTHFCDTAIINTLKIWFPAPWQLSETRLGEWSKMKIIRLKHLHTADVCNCTHFLLHSCYLSASLKKKQVKQWAGVIICLPKGTQTLVLWWVITSGGCHGTHGCYPLKPV